jgi:hypothetical protein
MRPSGETLVASELLTLRHPQHDYPNVLNANHLQSHRQPSIDMK